ncbi:DUF1795 domain-containing protein [Bacillus sp. BGMRC 2118]|nr:DUF1795 domain-containing protein [Bacillus sp. BGMRC 2118]
MKNKLLSLLFCMIAGVFALAGCNAEETNSKKEVENKAEETTAEATKANETAMEEDSDLKTITFEEISFQIPSTAEELDMGDQGLPMELYMLDAALGTNFNVLVETLPQTMSLDEYIELATANTGYEYLSKENFTSNGIEWNEAISLNHSDQGTVKLNQRTFIIEDKAYVFTYGAVPDNFDSSLDVYKDITDSVTVE